MKNQTKWHFGLKLWEQLLPLKKQGLYPVLVLTILLTGCKKIDGESVQSGILPGMKSAATSSVTGDEFTVVVMPDTQYLVARKRGGTPKMFQDMITWIKNNRTAENIVYVAGVGDIVDDGDRLTPQGTDPNPVPVDSQWINASSNGGYYALETPITGLPNGIPYGHAVGNHEQTPRGYPVTGTTNNYNSKFGKSHFSGRSYYGGSYRTTDNDSHYDLFSAGGVDFIVIYVELDEFDEERTALNNWVDGKLATYASRKAIIVSHFILGWDGDGVFEQQLADETPGFGSQASTLYTKIKNRPNVMMMLSGHVSGVGRRQDTYNGKTVKSFLTDFQNTTDFQTVPNGGSGMLRLLTFSKDKDLIRVRTYSPYLNQWLTDAYNQYDLPWFREEKTSRTADFDNDGKSQLVLFNTTTRSWTVQNMTLSIPVWGQAGDVPVSADYDGDGRTERAVYRPSNGYWSILGLPQFSKTWGGDASDIPVPADYDGDGKINIAVYRASNGNWNIDDAPDVEPFGQAGDIPVPADYDGDGKVNVAVFRPSTRYWHLDGIEPDVQWGQAGDIPVPGDYNGDGIVDIAVWRPSTGKWLINGMADITLNYFNSGDIPAPGDYFGLGKTQPAVYRPSNKTLYRYNNGTVTSIVLGVNGDKVVNFPYHIRKFFFP